MLSRFIGCCFPSDKNTQVQANDFTFVGDDGDNPSSSSVDMKLLKTISQPIIVDQANGQPKLFKPNLYVDKGSKTIMLDRLKIYNQSSDYEVFKCKIGNIAKIGATMVVPKPITKVEEKEFVKSVSIKINKYRKLHLKS